MDGLGRDDRVRYDTASFSGFSAATSYIADGGGDIAFSYATIGVQFVQNLKNLRTEYYLGFRHHSLDRDNTDYEDINAILSGFRVKL